MIKLLIVDDEPLVQAGIKSMINWEEHDIHIVGTASNGSIAYDMITQHEPDIVISDIKMPVMTGLELVKKCYDEKRDLPLFIILTSFEEFPLIKEAISYQVFDYLVKLELTADSLLDTLKRAIEKISTLRRDTPAEDSSISSLYLLKNQFYTRLILNLFESEQIFLTQSQNLNIDFSYDAFAVSYIRIVSEKSEQMASEKRINLYTSSLQMASELISKHIPCYVLSMDMKHFCIIFFLRGPILSNYKETIINALGQVSSMLNNYYGVTISGSIGSIVHSPLQIADSYQDAKQIFSQVSEDTPFLFLEDASYKQPLKNVFNMSLFREDIRKAYAEFDEKALYDIFTNIMELFEDKSGHYVQALDAASSILYLSLSLLSNGEQTISEIFENRGNGYRSLYELTNVSQILEWMKELRDGLCNIFVTHNKDYKNHIVVNVKKYIVEHIEEKLTLNNVAEVFNISPNYLSILFSKHNDVGFSDYINQSKIEAAKKMLVDGDYKIYEVSDILGFESAFYFSRVFKKITGLSPRDYVKNTL